MSGVYISLPALSLLVQQLNGKRGLVVLYLLLVDYRDEANEGSWERKYLPG